MITFLLACVMSDAERFGAAAQAPNAEEAFNLCEGIEDGQTRGDCFLRAAEAFAGERLEDNCPQVPEGKWRSECYFQAAERARQAKDIGRAGALCQKAEGFVDDCGQHLWQTELRSVARRAGSRGFPDTVEKARNLYEKWYPVLGQNTDFERRFWMRYYQNGFEGERVLFISACDRLTAELDVLRCRAAARSLYVRRVREAVIQAPRRANFCAIAVPDVAHAAASSPQLAAESDPLLDAVVAQHHQWSCVEGHLEPLEEQIDEIELARRSLPSKDVAEPTGPE